jgi:hypothetical protein
MTVVGIHLLDLIINSLVNVFKAHIAFNFIFADTELNILRTV